MVMGAKYTKIKDIELINLALADDQLAFSEILSRYRKAVYFLILKIVKFPEDAEDLTLITFSKAFLNLKSYTPTYRFATWIFRIASNSSIDFLRKRTLDTVGIAQGNTPEEGEVRYNQIKSLSLNPEEELIEDQRKVLAHQVIKKLNVEMESIIRLRFFEEYTYDEISQELDIPLGTVKVRIHRARKILQTILKENPMAF